MAVETWAAADPLAGAAGESPKANAALRDYALLGPGRSLRALLRRYQEQPDPPTRRLATLESWSSQNRWQARLADHDRQLYRDRLAAQATRQQAWEDKAWQVAHALLEKAEQMLKFPLVTTTTQDGQTTVRPARWSIDTVGRLVHTADRLARTATQPPAPPVELGEAADADVSPELDFILDELAAQVLADLAETEGAADGGDEP